jgi:replicative DNA helicase
MQIIDDSQTVFERSIPQDLEAEECLLGSLVIDWQLAEEVQSIISPKSFFLSAHGEIFGVICDLAKRGAVDPRLIATELQSRQLLKEIGGMAGLGKIVDSVPYAVHAMHYARIVASKAKLRDLIDITNRLTQRCFAPYKEIGYANELAEEFMQSLAKLASSGRSLGIESMGKVLETTYEELAGGGIPRIATGFEDLDALIGGLGVGEMTLIAARPSMGKSLLAKQIARQTAAAGTPVGYVSIEESSNKMGRNYISSVAGIDNHRVRRGSFSNAEWGTVGEVVMKGKDLPYFITDKPIKIGDVCAAIAVMVSRFNCKLIVVDYLQLAESDGGNTREQEVSRMSRRLKNMFKQLGVAGLVVAQLNRGNETGGIRPPRMSDLRDSGQIEQDADVILLLHRPGYYARETGGADDRRVFIIPAKNRDGNREKDVELIADLPHQCFIGVAHSCLELPA